MSVATTLKTLSCVVTAALLFACAAPLCAQTKEGPVQTLAPVTVTAAPTRGAVEKSFRKMIAGMDLFERLHTMAPAAALRFKLLPRMPGTDMDHIELEILGDTVAIPVRVEADHTFTLARDREALAENAAVTPNRRARSMTWRTDIRTPGLPPNTRRLGDLRLECRVGLEADLVSNLRPLIGRIAQLVTAMSDYCSRPETQYLLFADHPVFSVVMRDGAREYTVPVDRLYAEASRDPTLNADLPYCDCEVLLDRTYFLPLGDMSWPDDTRIEFEYMVDADVHAPQ